MKLSHHAILRMAQREISPMEVEEALANIQETTEADRPSRVFRTGLTSSGRRLRITQNTFEPQHIVTVIRLERSQ